ncbi:MAG: hemerythrin family protein [Sulfurospirillaceae bacterium]|jgi:hemerythrin|nr:hemerythrin family protein [Sulfurospirillaceae bacterium]MDD2826000.1 hemerythrin family protein [Sulfurospirillaceae bacterium]
MPKEWSESYSLHHAAIDAQHQELFRLANSVEVLEPKETTKEVLASLIKQFFNYMREHFVDEELYMQSIDYPLLTVHQKQHEDIITAMTDLLKNTKGIEALQTKMKIVSHKWLVEHILENDLKIVKWLKESNSIELDDYVIL